MDKKKLFIFAVFAIALAIFFRYEIVPVPPGQANYGIAYRLDRWTGDVVLIAGSTSTKVVI